MTQEARDMIEAQKRRIYEILEPSTTKDIASKSYDFLLTTAVVVGLVPMTLKHENPLVVWIDIVTSFLFIFDYGLRLYTADYKMGYKSIKAHIAYVFTPLAIFDVLSIIPIITLFGRGFASLSLLRLFRVFRAAKLVRYSKSMVVIANVIRKVRKQLGAVFVLVMVYIVISAMLMFQLEPKLFHTFFDALYWATISITTIGYGDISPVTPLGRVITMLSALMGMAVIALPTGIITASYMAEITKKKTKYEL
jgi:voltage-gated potassium channel